MVVYAILRAGQTIYELEELRTAIGRGDECDLALDGKGISRLHAELAFDNQGKEPCLTDLGSSNGTIVNGERLRPKEPFPLGHGDLIFFSAYEKTCYRFELPDHDVSELAPMDLALPPAKTPLICGGGQAGPTSEKPGFGEQTRTPIRAQSAGATMRRGVQESPGNAAGSGTAAVRNRSRDRAGPPMLPESAAPSLSSPPPLPPPRSSSRIAEPSHQSSRRMEPIQPPSPLSDYRVARPTSAPPRRFVPRSPEEPPSFDVDPQPILKRPNSRELLEPLDPPPNPMVFASLERGLTSLRRALHNMSDLQLILSETQRAADGDSGVTVGRGTAVFGLGGNDAQEDIVPVDLPDLYARDLEQVSGQFANLVDDVMQNSLERILTSAEKALGEDPDMEHKRRILVGQLEHQQDLEEDEDEGADRAVVAAQAAVRALERRHTDLEQRHEALLQCDRGDTEVARLRREVERLDSEATGLRIRLGKHSQRALPSNSQRPGGAQTIDDELSHWVARVSGSDTLDRKDSESTLAILTRAQRAIAELERRDGARGRRWQALAEDAKRFSEECRTQRVKAHRLRQRRVDASKAGETQLRQLWEELRDQVPEVDGEQTLAAESVVKELYELEAACVSMASEIAAYEDEASSFQWKQAKAESRYAMLEQAESEAAQNVSNADKLRRSGTKELIVELEEENEDLHWQLFQSEEEHRELERKLAAALKDLEPANQKTKASDSEGASPVAPALDRARSIIAKKKAPEQPEFEHYMPFDGCGPFQKAPEEIQMVMPKPTGITKRCWTCTDAAYGELGEEIHTSGCPGKGWELGCRSDVFARSAQAQAAPTNGVPRTAEPLLNCVSGRPKDLPRPEAQAGPPSGMARRPSHDAASRRSSRSCAAEAVGPPENGTADEGLDRTRWTPAAPAQEVATGPPPRPPQAKPIPASLLDSPWLTTGDNPDDENVDDELRYSVDPTAPTPLVSPATRLPQGRVLEPAGSAPSKGGTPRQEQILNLQSQLEASLAREREIQQLAADRFGAGNGDAFQPRPGMNLPKAASKAPLRDSLADLIGGTGAQRDSDSDAFDALPGLDPWSGGGNPAVKAGAASGAAPASGWRPPDPGEGFKPEWRPSANNEGSKGTFPGSLVAGAPMDAVRDPSDFWAAQAAPSQDVLPGRITRGHEGLIPSINSIVPRDGIVPNVPSGNAIPSRNVVSSAKIPCDNYCAPLDPIPNPFLDLASRGGVHDPVPPPVEQGGLPCSDVYRLGSSPILPPQRQPKSSAEGTVTEVVEVKPPHQPTHTRVTLDLDDD